jgi:hypothetical protein
MQSTKQGKPRVETEALGTLLLSKADSSNRVPPVGTLLSDSVLGCVREGETFMIHVTLLVRPPALGTLSVSCMRRIKDTPPQRSPAMGKCRHPLFSFRSRGGSDSRGRTTRVTHGRPFCAAPAAGRGRKRR